MEALVKPDETTITQVKVDYGNIPLYFIQNDGQIDKKVKYYGNSNGHSTYFTKEGVYMELIYTEPSAESSTSANQDNLVDKQTPFTPNHTVRLVSGGKNKNPQPQVTNHKSACQPSSFRREIIKLTPIGANKEPEIVVENMQRGKVNYLFGSDSKQWKTNIPIYRSVVYKEIYDGIDMKFYGNNRQMEYDIIVKPEADPYRVQFLYEGIEGLSTTEDGKLEITTKDNRIIQNKPYCYQEINGKRVEVAGNFKILNSELPDSKSEIKNPQFAYTFELSSYDDRYTLIIDPTLVYSSFFGGTNHGKINGIAVDTSGNVYYAGETKNNFPTTNFAFDKNYNSSSSYDAFVSKFDTTGKNLIYSTYLGGVRDDLATDIAVDIDGNAYITGYTSSPSNQNNSESDFPTTDSAFDKINESDGSKDAFVTKLDASGSSLIYSTCLGEKGNDFGSCIAIDTLGVAYVAGYTQSAFFPTTDLAFSKSTSGNYDTFVTKLDTSGSSLVYSTYLGSSSSDYIRDIALDNSGNAYVTGTAGSDFPTTTSAFDETSGGTFVTKLDATGSSLVFSTFLANGSANGIAIDTSRNIYITGGTGGNFPMAGNPYDPFHNGNTDIFVAKLESSGSNLVYSTYLGANGTTHCENKPDSGHRIALDDSRNIYIVGQTQSCFMPLASSIKGTGGVPAGIGYNGYIAKLNASGSSLLFASYFGHATDVIYTNITSMAVDTSGDMYIAGGINHYGSFPLVNAYDDDRLFNTKGFFAKIDFGINTNNLLPIANAGIDQSVNVNDTVKLDGTNSSDPDNDPLTYSWFFTSKPSSGSAVMNDRTSSTPNFMVDVAGTYKIHLVVYDGTAYSKSDEVTISVAANAAPVSNAGPNQSAYVGNLVTLDGSGSYDTDGDLLSYSWVFASTPTGSTATLSDTMLVNPTFTVDKSGTYIVELIVNDGSANSAMSSVSITTLNTVPVANAGPDNSVFVTNTVTLDGSGSSDVDGNILSYSWAFTSIPIGSNATLSDTTSVNPTFTVDVSGTYDIGLTVNDGTVDSTVETVTITTLNSAPVADAGPDNSVFFNDTVTLDGSGSSDVDGDLLTYNWALSSKPTGSGATLSNPTIVNPVFTVDKFGTYVVNLTVNDGTVNSTVDTVTITTLNSYPVSKAGLDQSVFVNDQVILDGSGSSDVDGDLLTYNWAFSTRPVESLATLSDATIVNPVFTVDVFGIYVLNLVVNDGTVDSTVDTVIITTLNSAPVANAGPDNSVLVTDIVTLDGSNSFDVDGDLLTYSWVFTSKPTDSTATLSDATLVNPTFTVDVFGTYVVSLTVNDGTVDSNSIPVTITTRNSAPVANAGSDDSVYVTDTVTLDGSSSSDVDGDLLTYNWSFTSKPIGSITTISNETETFASFVVDIPGGYVVQLIVNDGTVYSNPDTVTISTLNSRPIADAGGDQAVYVDNTVTLDGSNSWDVDGDSLTYRWAFTSIPASSTATLSDQSSVSPTFTIDKPGNYVLSLIVNDGELDSDPAFVTVSTINVAPVADAGGNQSGVVGNLITLNGSASYDVDGDPLSYTWAFASKPVDSTLVALTNSTSVTASFTPDIAGIFVVNLTVNDGTVYSTPDSASIAVVSQETQAIIEAQEVIDIINAIDPGLFKNPKNANALTNQIIAMIGMIENGDYTNALNKANSILKKTDGCANGGAPDKNDWIKSCETQILVYSGLQDVIFYLEALIP